MKRIVKDPKTRRLEIINAAEKLFEKKGYANTPVELIIKKAGIAKGTFYYYFKSKEDILHALVDQIGSQLESQFVVISEMAHLSAIEKLKLMLRGPEKKIKTKSEVMKVLHKPQNRELQEELNIFAIKKIAPLITKVFEQGKKEKLFTTSPSIEMVQIILAGSQFVLDSGLFSWTSRQRKYYLKSLQNMFELLLGVKMDSLNFISKE